MIPRHAPRPLPCENPEERAPSGRGFRRRTWRPRVDNLTIDGRARTFTTSTNSLNACSMRSRFSGNDPCRRGSRARRRQERPTRAGRYSSSSHASSTACVPRSRCGAPWTRRAFPAVLTRPFPRDAECRCARDGPGIGPLIRVDATQNRRPRRHRPSCLTSRPFGSAAHHPSGTRRRV
jgi:hypothetical protein